ncbi:hypothetical protein MKX01_040224 [Papaver californicum]|nr:hypothetical protein MKX01_040224 [Papaver californicum]
MIPGNIRLGQEYLYRKNLEGKERQLYENKREINKALEEGKPIPTELRNEEPELCRQIDLEDVNTENGIIVCHLPLGPTAYFGLHNVVTRHNIKDKKSVGTMSEAYPHLFFDNFSSKLGERTANILKHLFPVPKPDLKRIITLSNQSDYISFRLDYCLSIKLGTVDQSEAPTEFVIRPYMNTAKKQKILGD